MNQEQPVTPDFSFANKLLARLEQLKAQQDRNPMRDEIKIMYDLIRGQGMSGFRMMGAENIVYDNKKIMLQWQMGSGAKVDTVQFYYDYTWDLYKLRFITYSGRLKDEIKSDETVERLHVEDVRGLIENRTGFYLSF